jgi:hypothetical protein
MAYGRESNKIESNNIWLIYEPNVQEEGPRLDHKSMPLFPNKADNNTLPPFKIPWISSFRRRRWKCGVFCSRWVTSIHKHLTKLKCAVLIYNYTNVCWVVLPNYSTNYKLSNNNIIIRVAPNIPHIQYTCLFFLFLFKKIWYQFHNGATQVSNLNMYCNTWMGSTHMCQIIYLF